MDRTNITFHHLPILKTAETVRGSGPFTIETATAELAMLLFCEGRWSVASDSFCRVAEAEAMFTLPPGTALRAEPQDSAAYLLIVISGGFYCGAQSDSGKPYSCSVPLFLAKSPQLLQKKLQTVVSDCAKGNKLSAVGELMHFFNLYSKLDSQDDRHMMVEQMLEYIHTHLSGHLSIQEIAQYAGLSEPYCCNLFKKEKETTIVHYINQLRVEKAKEYIRHGAIPFKDAAAMVGIQNYTYFIRLFKQYTGMSPSEYRQQSQ